MDINTKPKQYKVGLAISAILLSVLALSFGDAMIKKTSLSIPIWQLFILRSCLALPVLAAVLFYRRSKILSFQYWVWVRSGLLVIMWLCYYTALPFMTLSMAAAIYYTSPIMITLLASLLARKSPTLTIGFAIVLGFVGVLLNLRPELGAFDFFMLLPLLAALLYASAMVLTAEKCADEDPILMALVLNIAFIVGGLVLSFGVARLDFFLFDAWVPLTGLSICVLAILAGAIVVGSIGAAIAYQNGPPAVIAAFDYFYLIFSMLWGWIIFSHFPDWIALVGIALIIAAGYLVIAHNAQAR